jgi:hypothetical protein
MARHLAPAQLTTRLFAIYDQKIIQCHRNVPSNGTALEPITSLELRCTLIEGIGDQRGVETGLAAAYDEGCTSVVRLGAPTA